MVHLKQQPKLYRGYSLMIWRGAFQRDLQGVGQFRADKRVKREPGDAFWSITVYNAEGCLQPNPDNAYSFNKPHGLIVVSTRSAKCEP